MEIRSRENVDWDRELSGKDGWEGLKIWWLVDKEGTGIEGATMNVVDFPPGTGHEVHRHDNAPELCYIEAGQGLHMTEGDPVRLKAGEVVAVPPGEWHGFWNDSDEVVRMVTFWPGVNGYSDLGYESQEGWKERLDAFLERQRQSS